MLDLSVSKRGGGRGAANRVCGSPWARGMWHFWCSPRSHSLVSFHEPASNLLTPPPLKPRIILGSAFCAPLGLKKDAVSAPLWASKVLMLHSLPLWASKKLLLHSAPLWASKVLCLHLRSPSVWFWLSALVREGN